MFEQKSGLEALLHRSHPSSWELFLRSPCVFLAQKLYSWRRIAPAVHPIENSISVVCISDTHNGQSTIPDGDILIHAGDLTQSGSLEELVVQIAWLRAQSHAVKIVIGGNHDLFLDPSRPNSDGSCLPARQQVDWGDITYLQDNTITVHFKNGRTLNVYGSPSSPRHGNWAFQYPRERDVWSQVPDNTDILITHAPPRAHLDLNSLGCRHLLRTLWRTHPLLHVFGHVHAGYGHERIQFDELQNAYERTILEEGGLGNLFGVIRALIQSYIRAPGQANCQLVNASQVGGLRDDEGRQPIKVFI
jgi:Icc-related predicted phosphoesterase